MDGTGWKGTGLLGIGLYVVGLFGLGWYDGFDGDRTGVKGLLEKDGLGLLETEEDCDVIENVTDDPKPDASNLCLWL